MPTAAVSAVLCIPPGSDSAPRVHSIWLQLVATKMQQTLQRCEPIRSAEDAESYSVPRIDDHAGSREKFVSPPEMELIEKCKVL